MSTAPTLLHVLNSSWTLHRLSPFYHGKEAQSLFEEDGAALKIYASRLRDLLRGEVLRGVQVGLSGGGAGAGGTGSDDALVKAGPLRDVSWRALTTDLGTVLGDDDDGIGEEQRRGVLAFTQRPGIFVVLRYESATYTAVLLQGGTAKQQRPKADDGGFTHFPLLLTRLPPALRNTFLSFLASNFDCRCSVLRLPPSFLLGRLESCLMTFGGSSGDGRIDASMLAASEPDTSLLQSIIKDAKMSIAFRPPIAPALRNLDISLPRKTISEFIAYGRGASKISSTSDASTPFLTALSTYTTSTLAFNFSLQSKDYYISRIACGIFILGTEGKAKVVLESKFLDSLAANLVARGESSTDEEREFAQMLEEGLGEAEKKERAVAVRIALGVVGSLVLKAVAEGGKEG